MLVGHAAGNASALQGHLRCQCLAVVFVLTDPVAGERVRGDDVRARSNILAVDIGYHLGPRQVQRIVVACDALCLNLCAHGSVQNQDALFQMLLNRHSQYRLINDRAKIRKKFNVLTFQLLIVNCQL